MRVVHGRRASSSSSKALLNRMGIAYPCNSTPTLPRTSCPRTRKRSLMRPWLHAGSFRAGRLQTSGSSGSDATPCQASTRQAPATFCKFSHF
jgi:hypothetical protein